MSEQDEATNEQLSEQGEQQVHPHPSCLPKTLTRSFIILGVETDAWIQLFADRVFFGVSQFDRKVGTYLLCEAERSETNPRHTDYHLSTLLGNREDAMLGVYARTLSERIQAVHHSSLTSSSTEGGNDQPPTLLLGMSLDKEKGNSPEMFRNLVNVLVDMYVDAVKDNTLQE